MAMSAEWDPPFGSAGETTVPRNVPAPQPQPVAQFVIEPPPWKDLDAHPELLAPPEPPAPRPTAIEELMAREMELGAIDEIPAPGPPPAPPPQPPRFVPPPPDWELEEKLAIARNKRERLEQARRVIAEHALNEEQPTRHPPPRRERS